MIVAEVVNVLADEELFDPETDAFRLEDAGLFNYTHGHYYAQGEPLGKFGFPCRKGCTQGRRKNNQDNNQSR